jgi:hypothetical protein
VPAGLVPLALLPLVVRARLVPAALVPEVFLVVADPAAVFTMCLSPLLCC